MRFFLALDAGGTKTECWLANEDRVLARVTGETVKLMNVGEDVATARLRDLLHQVSASAGVSLADVTRTCVGMAGISSEGVRVWAEATVHAMVAGELVLTGDDEIALRAAFGESPGVLVLAGTGSRVVGRCTNGMRVQAGGWGPMLGDEGSGQWIGVEAIRSALRARDRGLPSSLLKDISSVWETSSVGAVIAKANQEARPDFAVLAETVVGCAARGDALAISVLERAGEELAAQVSVVFSKMQAAGCAGGDIRRVAFAGRVLARSALVLAAMTGALKRVRPGTEVDAAPVLPIEGALARARA